MPATIYTINKLLNQQFGGVSAGSPASWYIGLSTGSLSQDTTSGSEAVEPTGGYARIEIKNTSGSWTTSTAGSIINAVSGSFGASTGNWGTIRTIFLADSAVISEGNIWYYYTLSPSISVQTSTTLPIDVGSIIISGS